MLSSQLMQVGDQEIIDRGVIYSNLDNLISGEKRVSDLRRIGKIQHKVFGLQPNASYSIKAYVKTESGEFLSDAFTFKTEAIPQEPFSLGDKGPGGGIVFFDGGDYSKGYRYMEARSLEAAFYDNFVWSPLEFRLIGTSRNFGTGETNTDIYLQKILNTNPLNAFYSASVFEENGYRDWFIPSVEELKVVFENLSREQILQEFKRINSDRFLSSSEVDRERVYLVNAENQAESISFKGIGHNVIVVRVF